MLGIGDIHFTIMIWIYIRVLALIERLWRWWLWAFLAMTIRLAWWLWVRTCEFLGTSFIVLQCFGFALDDAHLEDELCWTIGGKLCLPHERLPCWLDMVQWDIWFDRWSLVFVQELLSQSDSHPPALTNTVRPIVVVHALFWLIRM